MELLLRSYISRRLAKLRVVDVIFLPYRQSF